MGKVIVRASMSLGPEIVQGVRVTHLHYRVRKVMIMPNTPPSVVVA